MINNKEKEDKLVHVLMVFAAIFLLYIALQPIIGFIFGEGIVPILLSVAFSFICLTNLKDYSSESEEGKSFIKRALSSTAIGYLLLALTLFVSTKTVEITSSNVKEVDATIVNIRKDNVLLSNNGSFEVIEDVMGVKGLKLGDKISTISYEERVAHFKSWTGITKDARRKVVTLKGS